MLAFSINKKSNWKIVIFQIILWRERTYSNKLLLLFFAVFINKSINKKTSIILIISEIKNSFEIIIKAYSLTFDTYIHDKLITFKILLAVSQRSYNPLKSVLVFLSISLKSVLVQNDNYSTTYSLKTLKHKQTLKLAISKKFCNLW